tara:strand:- start:785 stop:1771 length:987 start_codon:yes stop_codon:yes gene_type:complete
MKNILISGGAGYIGSCIANLLIEKKYKVTIIDNLTNGYKYLVPKKATFIKCDIANKKKIQKILKSKKFDFLVHLAAYIKVDESVIFPKKYFKNNVIKSKVFINTCLDNGIDNIIFSSTAAAYKTGNKPLNEKSIIKPKSPYAKNKIEIEKFLMKIKNDKKKIFILRYFNVVGAYKNLKSGQISRNSTHLFKVLSEYIVGKRKKFFINGVNFSTKDGTAIRDFIDINDLCNIHLLIIKKAKKLKSSIFNCGYGRGLSVMEIFLIAKKVFLKNLIFLKKKRRDGDQPSSVANVSKIKKVLKFKPRFNNIKNSLLSSVKWEAKISKKKNLF